MTSRNTLKLTIISRDNVSRILGSEFVLMLEEIEKSIEVKAEDKRSPTPPSQAKMSYGSTSNFSTNILQPPPPQDFPEIKKNTTIIEAFNQVITELENLPTLSEFKKENESKSTQLIESLDRQVNALVEVAKLSGNEIHLYRMIKGLTLLAKGIVYLASILSGAIIGNTAGSAAPVMAIPGAATGAIIGYKAADKALLACSNYVGINMFNRRPQQAKTTEKLAEILENKRSTFRI